MTAPAQMYLDLLKNTLSDIIRLEKYERKPFIRARGLKGSLLYYLNNLLRKRHHELVTWLPVNMEAKINGKDLHTNADSMIGLKRLNNIQYCLEKILEENIPGDIIETGIWKGGATIFIQGVLKAHGATNRTVWGADSFEGLPRPDEEKYQADTGDTHYLRDELKIDLENVKARFKRYGLLDDNVKFLKGWFKDTLPGAPIEKLSLIRLDGDMYESTIDGLVNLYPKLSMGGYIIIDDYNSIKACKKAVTDYRVEHGIEDEIIEIDFDGVYWKKTK